MSETTKRLFILFGLCAISQLTDEQVESVRSLANISELDQISTERLLEIFLKTERLKAVIPTGLALRAPLT